jgi:hypothetical protein
MAPVASPSNQAAASNTKAYTVSALATFENGGAGQSLTQASSIGGFSPVPANEPLDNLPFDPRINRAALRSAQGPQIGAGSGGVTGGRISTPSPAPGANGAVFAAYFLFNPTEIDLQYNFDTSVTGAINPAYAGNQANDDPQGLMLNQTQSFTLLFDRTYELWSGRQAAGYDSYLNGGPYFYGVQWDVWAIERLAGIYGQAAGHGPSGPPASAICTVQFGGALTSETVYGTPGTPRPSPELVQGAILPAVNFQGWMTNFSVEYTRFDGNMVPSRCAISLSFMQVYSLPAVYTTAPGDGGQGAGGTGTPADDSSVLPVGGGVVVGQAPTAKDLQSNTPGLSL